MRDTYVLLRDQEDETKREREERAKVWFPLQSNPAGRAVQFLNSSFLFHGKVHAALGTAERELAAQDRELDRRHAIEEEENKVHEEIQHEIVQLWTALGVDPHSEIPGDSEYMGKLSKLCVTLSALTTRVQLRIQDEEGRAHRALAYVEVIFVLCQIASMLSNPSRMATGALKPAH